MPQTDSLDGSTVFVTGATGFIGSHLVDALLDRNCEVHCLVRPNSNTRWLDLPRLHPHSGTLNNHPDYAEGLKRADYVFHCAGVTQAKSEQEYLHTNAHGCAAFYQACVENKSSIKRIIHLSTTGAVGPGPLDGLLDETTPCHPVTDYGASKLAGEVIALSFSSLLPVIILRPPKVYGERETKLVPYFKTLQRGYVVQFGKVERRFSMIYVKDLVQAMLDAAVGPLDNPKVFMISDGESHNWDSFPRTALKVLGNPARQLILPEIALDAAARMSELGGWIRRKPPLLDRQRVIDMRQPSWVVSSDLFFKHYSFKPQYNLHEGLSRTIEWYRTHNWL